MANSETFGANTLTLVTAGGPVIKVKVIAGPDFSGSDDGHQATWSVLIDEADLTDFINGLFPPSVLLAFGSGYVSIKPPNQILPGSGFFYATSYTAKPFKRDIADPFRADNLYITNNTAWGNTYSSLYRVDITFSTRSDGRTDDNGGDQENPADKSTLIDDHTVEVGGQFLRIGDNSLRWDVGNGQNNDELQVGVTQTIPHIVHSISRRRVRNPAWTTIANLLGHVNDVAVTVQDFGIVAEAECVMFVGASGRLLGGWGGGSEWAMDYKFIHREFLDEDFRTITWNHFYRPKAAAWQKLLIRGAAGDRDVYIGATLGEVFNSNP